MPEPLRSPKQSRAAAKAQAHPYGRPSTARRTARDAGGEGSTSLIGAFKSFVKAPLSWLSTGASKESNGVPNGDIIQKRKVSFEERSSSPPPISKRPRRISPTSDEEAAQFFEEPYALLGRKRPFNQTY
ncbi:hypothetical protein M422DRAFT_252490 [Sphaerobolus stellatus SS14]|uniref:Uncharacterized protein n=1 Tax=Sphaerobolus stellatus (strain SS14) TaxID=990650 RepID=A0A0C9VZM1_SPHS4|nr:hypothetical protein M422DRAFT_252490 [Sphaerobolus stellatus SS14]